MQSSGSWVMVEWSRFILINSNYQILKCLLKVELGSTLRLDCPVSRIGASQVMLWKKGHRVLTAGTIKVRRDPRMELDGTDLTIGNVGIHDGGLYRCEVEQDADQPLVGLHTVEILGERQQTFHRLWKC